MTRSRPITFLASAAVIPLSALAVAACGGGGDATAAPAPAPAPASSTTTTAPTTSKTAAVRVAKSSLGSILVNSSGRTLYLFKADVGAKSACTGACAAAWPPLLTTGKPTAGAGLTASKLATTTRPGGKQQVTYNGHPLYLFIQDKKPGQTTGQGVTAFGAPWFAVSASGNQVSRPQPGPKSAPKPAPPAAKPAPPVSNDIPQDNGGDHDSDNNGGPSDGDGNV